MAIEIFRPTSRAEWLALRGHDITASEGGGLFDGVHDYETRYSLFLAKTGRMPPDGEIETPAMARGRALEPVAVQFAAEYYPGAKLEHNVECRYWRDPTARLGATPDLIVDDPNRGRGVVQLKSIEPSIYARKWIDNEPPLWIAIQALIEAKLVGAQFAAVGALRVGWRVDFDLVEIPLHDGLWAAVKAEAAAFWRSVALDQPPAPDFERDLDTIRALNMAAVPGASIDLSNDREFCAALIERERLKRGAKDFARRCDQLEALIRHKAGDNQLVIAGDYRVTLKTEQVAEHTVKPHTRRPLRVKLLREAAA